MIDLEKFKMNVAEEALLGRLAREAQPKLIAEFGCGLTTRFWAQQTEARIVTWDNFPEWIAQVQALFKDEPWFSRLEFRHYAVTPAGPRDVEKDPVPWDGPKFDFLFLDGPRSAHPPNFGRSGTFRFATQHAAERALIVWHDANRPHERQMARRYLGHCARRRAANVGWCRWEAPRGGLLQSFNRLNPLA
ncbi:MAG: Methyltransferase domain [Chthoniobacter sp.]|nr:Methyltransferase domain [Chthoniobacter sp.]